MGLEGGEVVVGPDGVVGRLMEGTMFVVDGTEGVVGALIVVVGLGNWLGGPAGRPATFSIFNSQRVSFRGTFLSYRIEKKGEMRGVKLNTDLAVFEDRSVPAVSNCWACWAPSEA